MSIPNLRLLKPTLFVNYLGCTRNNFPIRLASQKKFVWTQADLVMSGRSSARKEGPAHCPEVLCGIAFLLHADWCLVCSMSSCEEFDHREDGPWMCLWEIILILLIVEGPISIVVRTSPRAKNHGVYKMVKVSWVLASIHKALLLMVGVMLSDASSSWRFDFLTVKNSVLELWARIKPWSLKLLSFGYFHHNNRKKTLRHGAFPSWLFLPKEAIQCEAEDLTFPSLIQLPLFGVPIPLFKCIFRTASTSSYSFHDDC